MNSEEQEWRSTIERGDGWSVGRHWSNPPPTRRRKGWFSRLLRFFYGAY
jgi:hypothetical protein